MVPDPSIQNPFRGLRPFEAHERHLFFGRGRELEALEERLENNHFLGVVGTSGSGKSSLVRAGLIPELLDFGDWRVALMRPGDNPIGNLAKALNSTKANKPNNVTFWGQDEGPPNQGNFTLPSLRQGTLGLIDVIAEFRINEKILIVVDQFEEIFRFVDRSSPQKKIDAHDFVRLLVEASRQRKLPIYVCLTMRSDFLGQCPIFPGLPEVLNDSQYLVPRLTRAEIRETIIKPVTVAGAKISPRLVTKLLNEVVDSQDQLPLLQHALMRTFDKFTGDRSSPVQMDIQHFSGMQIALSEHADSLISSFRPEQKRIAEKLFKLLTTMGTNGSAIRRPCTVQEALDVTQGSSSDLFHVIDVFRAPANSFLMPPLNEALSNDTKLDISHESLIRVWPEINHWIEEEQESSTRYLRLVEDAEAWRDGKRGLLGQPELDLIKKWKTEAAPTQQWANRYSPSLHIAFKYLAKSNRKFKLRRAVKRSLPVMLVLSLWLYYYVGQKAEVERLKLEVTAAKGETERLVSDLVEQFGENFPSSSKLEQKEYFRLLAPFVKDDASKPGDQFYDYLDTMLLIQRTDKHLHSGNKELLTSIYRALNSRIEAHTKLQDYSDSPLALYFVRALTSVKTLYPLMPLHKVSGGNAAFAKNGIVIAADNRDFILFDETKTREGDRKTQHRLAGEIIDLAISEDASRMITITDDVSVQVWNVSSKGELTALNHNIDISSELENQKEIPKPKASRRLTVARLFEPAHLSNDAEVDIGNRSWAMVANNTGQVGLWDEKGNWQAFLFDASSTESILSVTPSIDGKQVYTTSADGLVRKYELVKDKLGIINPTPLLLQHGEQVFDSAILRDGNIVTTSGDQFVRVWDADGYEKETLAAPDKRGIHRGSVIDIELSADGKYLATAGQDNIINIWLTKDMSSHKMFLGALGSKGIKRVRFHPDFDGKQNQKILVSTNVSDSGIANTFIWDLSQFGDFDESILVKEELNLTEKLKLGLIYTSNDINNSMKISDLIAVLDFLVKKRSSTSARIDSYLVRLENDVYNMLKMLKSRDEIADESDKLKLRLYYARLYPETLLKGWSPKVLEEMEEVLLNTKTENLTPEFCFLMQDIDKGSIKKLNVDLLLNSPHCVASNKLRDLPLDKALEGKSQSLIVQTLSENKDQLASVINSIKTANNAVYKRKLRLKPEALKWAQAAIHLSKNPVTLDAFYDVISRQMPTPISTYRTGDKIKTVTFSTDGESVFAGGMDNNLHQFSLHSAPPLVFSGHTGGIYAILQLQSGEVMTSAMDNKIIRWNLTKNEPIINTTSFTKDDVQAYPQISGSLKNGFIIDDYPAELIDLEGNTRHIFPKAFRALTLDDNKIVLLKPNSGELSIIRIEGDSVVELASTDVDQKGLLTLAANGKYIATGGLDGTVIIWDMDLKQVKKLPILDNVVRILKFRSETSSILIGTYSGMVYEFDLQGKKIMQFKADTGRVYGLDIHPSDPNLILTGGNDGVARLWNIENILEFQQSKLHPTNPQVSLDELVKYRVLTSKHLQYSLLLEQSASVAKAANYLQWVRDNQKGDNFYDIALRKDAEAALELLRTNYGWKETDLDKTRAVKPDNN